MAFLLAKRNNYLIKIGVKCDDYNPDSRLREIKSILNYKYFKSIEKLGFFSRAFAGFVPVNKELHFIGITDNEELHIGLYSGKDFFYDNYIAKVYNLDRRLLFEVAHKKNQEDTCKFFGHLFEDDKVWLEIRNKIGATEAKTFLQKAGTGLKNIFQTKCPKCKEKGFVESAQSSKQYLDKIYKETASSRLSSAGSAGVKFGGNDRSYAWYYIYNLEENHECGKCGHKWHTSRRVEEKG